MPRLDLEECVTKTKRSILLKTVSLCTRLPCNVHKGNRTIHQLQMLGKQKASS